MQGVVGWQKPKDSTVQILRLENEKLDLIDNELIKVDVRAVMIIPRKLMIGLWESKDAGL